MQSTEVPPARSAEPWTAEATPAARADAAGAWAAGSGGAKRSVDGRTLVGGKTGLHGPQSRRRGEVARDPRPIGVFDSGVGGLTVVRALRRALPHEAIVYLGDTARVPYGLRSADVVRRYALGCAQFLLARGAKMVVVACNTASAHALEALQAALPVPVVGVVEAGAALAATAVSRGHLGVLATEGTVASNAYPRALARLAPQLRVRQVACPMFVPLCEEGLMDHAAARLLAEDYLRPLLQGPLDALLLGCTHYPLLAPLLQQLVGPNVRLLDSATAAAHGVRRSLEETGLGADAASAASPLTLYATDVTERLRRVAQSFLSGPVPMPQLVNLGDAVPATGPAG